MLEIFIKIKDKLLPVFIFFIFIVTFYFINNYSTIKLINEPEILDKASFEDNLSENIINGLSLEKVDKFTLPYMATDLNLINNDLFVVNTSIKQNINRTKKTLIEDQTIRFFNAKNKTETKLNIDDSNVLGVRKSLVSPNGKKILFLVINYPDKAYESILYNVENKNSNIDKNQLFTACWLYDSDRYIGVDNYVFIKDTVTGKRTNLISVEQLFGRMKDIYPGFDIDVSKDNNYVYITYNNLCAYFDINKTSPYFVALGKKSISGVTILKSNKLAFETYLDNSSEIDIYDGLTGKSNSLINIPENKLSNFVISDDGKMLIYTELNDGSNELHAANIEGDKIYKDQLIYKDSKFLTSLKLSNNNKTLTFLAVDKDSSTIYKFDFRK